MSQFFKEVKEQPDAIRSTIIQNKNEAIRFSGKPILLTGMGSSLAASQLAALYLNHNGQVAHAVDNSELLHYQSRIVKQYQPFVTSQSGESYEAKELLKRHGGFHAFTNTPGSFVAKHAAKVYYTHAGTEKAIASSKSFTSTIALMLYLFGKATGDDLEEKLLRAADVMEQILSEADEIGEKISTIINPYKPLLLIGRGPSVITADQGGLTLKETARIYTESLSSAQFRHGPFELIKEDFQCMLFNPRGKTFSLNASLAEEIAHLGGKVLYISDEAIFHKNILSIPLESVDEFVSPIVYSVIVQIAAVKLSAMKGLVAGEAELISKVTGRE